jgi:hypothetical protein
MILQFSQIRLTLARTFMIQQLHAGAGWSFGEKIVIAARVPSGKGALF